MSRPTNIIVSESLQELKQAQKGSTLPKQKRLQMLVLIKKGTHSSVDELSQALGVSPTSIQTWRSRYKKGGLDFMLEDNRGGYKKGQITPEIKEQLAQRLSNPSEAFSSFGEAQQWINREFGLDMQYHAVNKYFKRHFKAKLKVARKSHVDKDPAAAAVFKKPVPST